MGNLLERLAAKNSIPPPAEARREAVGHLRALFAPQEYVFLSWHFKMPARLGSTVRSRLDWEAYLETCDTLPTFLLPNPISPVPMPNRQGSASLRGTNSITAFRHLAVEFDQIPPSQQRSHWAQYISPQLTALVSTGAGTLQGVIRIDASDEESWKKCGAGWVARGCRAYCTRTTFLARLAGGLRRLGSGDSEEGWRLVPQELLFLRPRTWGDAP